MERTFYVYVHKDQQGRVFYVGKGTGKRAWSKDRHPIWTRYVETRLGGTYLVEIVREGLGEEEALDLEDELIEQHADHVVNWVNLYQPVDSAAYEQYWLKRKESDRLLALAKATSKSEPLKAVQHCREAVALVHQYASIVLETGLVEELRKECFGARANPHAIYRLAQCLKQADDLPALVREVDEYFDRYPLDRGHYRGVATLKLRDRIHAQLSRGAFPRPATPDCS